MKINKINSYKPDLKQNHYHIFKGNSVFSDFPQSDTFCLTAKKDNINNAVNVTKKKSILPAVLIGAAIIGAAALFIYAKRGTIKDFMEVSKLKKLSYKLDKKFPQDAKYREKIASAIGLSPEESYRISSIGGTQEFTETIEKLSKTPEVYSPGIAKYNPNGSISEFDNKNVLNRTFEANFHMHTVNSDGELTVQELLDKAAEYANERFKKFKKPFNIAITDHDTTRGCKQAVDIISKSPEKYKNLRLFLGCENTAIYKNPELLNNDAQIHVLSYGINPYSKDFVPFLTQRIEKNHTNIKSAISNANTQFSDLTQKLNFKYEFDDMTKISPSIGVGLRTAKFYMKDYLQFKPIYQMAQNKEISSLLEKNGINLSEINYAMPIKMIPSNPDYSKGQKYYEHYYEALKSYIISLIKTKNAAESEEKIKKLFPPIDKNMSKVLQNIENKTLDHNSSVFVKAPEFLEFDECITQLGNLEDGVMSMAHPGVFFPVNSAKKQENIPKIYEKLYSIFTDRGGKKANFSEDLYQGYYNDGKENIIAQLQHISKRHNLMPTGGLDTHGKSIFSV